jgi:regulatory protein
LSSNEFLEQIIRKSEAYCAYQDRCRQEVIQKLHQWKVEVCDHETIIHHLQEHGFLDEDRYAQSFVTGKFRIKKWGKRKIQVALTQKGISASIIHRSLAQIEDTDYIATLRGLMLKKMGSNYPKDYKSMAKLFNYLCTKGYETDLVQSVWNDGNLKNE